MNLLTGASLNLYIIHSFYNFTALLPVLVGSFSFPELRSVWSATGTKRTVNENAVGC